MQLTVTGTRSRGTLTANQHQEKLIQFSIVRPAPGNAMPSQHRRESTVAESGPENGQNKVVMTIGPVNASLTAPANRSILVIDGGATPMALKKTADLRKNASMIAPQHAMQIGVLVIVSKHAKRIVLETVHKCVKTVPQDTVTNAHAASKSVVMRTKSWT